MSQSHYDVDNPYQQDSFGSRMFGSVELSPERMALVKGTYGYLALSVIMAVAGAYFGANSPAVLGLFSSPIAFLVAMAVLWITQSVALAMRHNPVLGVIALLADGFLSGLILGPIIYFACVMTGSPDIVINALVITGLVFAGVTAMVWTSGKRYSAPRGLMGGLLFAGLGLIVLSFLMPGDLTSPIGLALTGIIGVIGVMTLVYGTSNVLHDPTIDSPITGAVILFAGLFNVFVAVLRILLTIASLSSND